MPTSAETAARELIDGRIHATLSSFDERAALLRRESPVHWTEVDGYRPFWAITKHADVAAISKLNDQFLNGPRLYLDTIEVEQIREKTFGSADVFRTIAHMDEPDHRIFRNIAQTFFLPGNLKKIEADVSALAGSMIDSLAQRDDCDFATDFAGRYPVSVIMAVLGLPQDDVPLIINLTQELMGGASERKPDADTDSIHSAIGDLFAYFKDVTKERRARPRDDLSSVIANAQIDGRPINELEALSYYIIIVTAGHHTTAYTLAGGLHALLQNPRELKKLEADPDLLPKAIEEMFRWVTPGRHFMRTAVKDFELRGKNIRGGEAVLLWYPSANRDEEVFEDPTSFRVDRSPNPHIAFGTGAHMCLGHFLAKMEMRAFFSQFLPRLSRIELAGEAKWTESSWVSGIRSLPIEYALKRSFS